MFLGEYTHTLDDKNRLTIPAKFRAALAGGGIVTRGYEKCLLVYTASAFAALSARVRALSPTDPTHRALFRHTFAGASEVELDRQGRILIPAYLRDYATLADECVVVGVGDWLEVWNPADWAAQLQTFADPARNAERFAALDIAPLPNP